jgi:hypothetical protein
MTLQTLGRVNNGMQRTRTQQAYYHQRFVRAADAGRYALSLYLRNPMKSPVIRTLTGILLFVQPSILAHAQTGSWRIYTPSKQSFSIEAPAPLRKVESFSGEHQASLERSQRIDWATCYAAIETTPEASPFGIIVINARQKFIRSQPRDKLYWYLGAVLIGNEDEAEPINVKEINVNGLKGKEYIYTRGGVSTRGRIFEVGGKIYVVVFVGKDDNDLTSFDAERFLNSFRLRKR